MQIPQILPDSACMQPLPEASSLVCNQVHTPSATSHTLSQASVRPSITFCLASVSLAHILPGLLLTRHAPETRAFYESSRCPSPSPHSVLSSQQVHCISRCSGNDLLKSVLHSPHHITSFLCVIIVLLNFSIFPLGPPSTVTQASPRGKSCHQSMTQN